MSDLLYSTRLWWDGRHGLAMLLHVQHRIEVPPPGFEGAEYIDYAPEVRCAQWRPAQQRMREMEPDEVRAADAYLLSVCGPAAAATTTTQPPP